MLKLVIFLLGFWSVTVCAIQVDHQAVLQAGLKQPVSISANASGQLALLDGNGLQLSTGIGQLHDAGSAIAKSALDVFFYKNQWLVAEPENHRLLILNSLGKTQNIIDVSQTADGKKLSEPVAVAANAGLLYWADRANHRICRYDLEKKHALDCFGKRGEMDGEFQYPYQMAFDRDGYLYVVDILNARVQMFDKTGRFFASIGHFGSGTDELFRPNGIAIDTQHDLVFVSDSYFGTIKLFHAGDGLGELKNPAGKPIVMKSPTGLSWQQGKLFVAETFANQLTQLSVTGLDDLKPVANKDDDSELSQKNCLICHLSWAKQGNAPDVKNVLPEASMLMCYSCHNGAIMDSRFRIAMGGQHASVYDSDELKRKRHEQKRKDKLPEIFPRTESKDLPCTSCHTPHTKGEGNQTLYEGNKNAWLRVPNKNGDMCERCHESKIKQARELDVKNRGINHPLAIKLAPPPFKDAPGFAIEDNLHKGLPKEIAEAGGVLGHEDDLICQTCHQVHGGHGDRELTALANDKAELCVTCHEKQNSKDKKDAHKKSTHPVNIKPEKTMKQDNVEVKLVSCQSCHKVHDGKQGTSLIAEKYEQPDDLCQTCHERQSAKDKDDARRKGVHPVNIEPDKNEKPMKKDNKEVKFVSCQTCHNVHDGKPDTALLDKGIKDAEALCQTCHDRQHAKDKDDAFKKGVHPVNIKMDEAVEIVKDKKTKEVGCLTCHAVHTGKPNTPALVEDDKNGQLCAHCHAGKQAVVGSDHDLRITAKDKPNQFKEKPSAGVCSACHTLHRGENKAPHMYAAKPVAEDITDKDLQHSALKTDKLCINCHQKNGIAEKKVVKAFNHPHKDMVLRSDKKIMPLFDSKEKVNEFGEIACITCHDPHFWKPEQLEQSKIQAKLIKPTGNKENVEGTPLTSFLRRKGVKESFCVDCHGLQAITKYKYFHDPKLVRNIGVDYLK
jgi:predicted CXXCH cytochrome family protein